MNTSPHVRRGMKFGIVLVIVYAVISCGTVLSEQYGVYIRFTRHFGDPISEYEKRFTGLKEAMPKKGALGFLIDVPAPFLMGNDRRTGTLYLTQYVLAPLVLYDNVQYPLVVGNFHSTPHPSAEQLKKLGLRPIANYGDGVVLFKREGME